MKTPLSILVAAAAFQLLAGCSNKQTESALLIQGRSVADWVREVEIEQFQTGKNPGLDALISAGAPVMPDFARFLLEHGSSAEQAKAAYAIGVIAHRNPDAVQIRDVVPSLITAAQRSDSWVVIYSVQALSAIGKAAEKATPVLLRLTKDENESVRMCAVESLGRIGVAKPEIVDALERAMSDPKRSIRIVSIRALHAIGQSSKNSIPVLIELTTDEEVGVRMSAIETMGLVGAASREAVAALKLAQLDTNTGISALASKALAMVGSDLR